MKMSKYFCVTVLKNNGQRLMALVCFFLLSNILQRTTSICCLVRVNKMKMSKYFCVAVLRLFAELELLSLSD